MLLDVKTALLPTLEIRFSLQHNHFEFLQQTHKFNSLQFCIENIVLNKGSKAGMKSSFLSFLVYKD